jgi:hypothetical protein
MTAAFIEFLGVRAWCLSILPRLVWSRLRDGRKVGRCYAFDSSSAGMAVARASQWLAGTSVEPLRFRLRDVCDEEGLLLRLRIAYQDLAEAQADILADPRFRGALEGDAGRDRFPAYLAKAIATISLTDRQTLWRALLTIQVCRWTMRRTGATGVVPVYFIERRVWQRVIDRYASRFDVHLVPVPRAITLRRWWRPLITPGLRRLFYRLQVRGMLGGRKVSVRGSSRLSHAIPRPRVAVEYWGHLQLDHPERYSDLFFWQQSSLAGSDVLVTFNVERDPVDGAKLAELAKHGIDGIALRPRVAQVSEARAFIPSGRVGPDARRLAARPGGAEGRWLKAQLRNYGAARAFWTELFDVERVGVFVSWFKYTELHCAIADALASLGGVTAIYERAYESHPSAETAVMADVVFGFSPVTAEIERRSGSVIPYYVATGYLGDHRFPLLRQEALRARRALQRHGAQRIVAFTDENSVDDERWHTGHSVEREHYAFLLERVLSEPWLGLVLKPKTPATLRRRLGPVAELLERAEATGRCFVFEGGAVQGSHPPMAAALAADLMIHGHLNAGTAGMEAALAGVPTLLLDALGWRVSPFYRLGTGRVVFTDWQSLWNACLEHWKRPGGVPGLGDWSPMLDELDPFRDGRAAERMGTYIRWLLDGFEAGLPRATVLADAAERYTALWGKDKVTQVNWNGWQSRAEGTARARVSDPDRIPAR